MQGFNLCGYEVRLFGATVAQAFDVMDAMTVLVRKLLPFQRPRLSEINSILDCYSGDTFEFTWQILDNRRIV